jgi:hypothetical protein
MRFLWILFLSIPLLASLLLVVVFLFAMVERGWDARMYVVAIIFGAITAYLFRLLTEAFKPDGGLVADYSGTDKVNLSWSGKEPGFFTYASYVLLGPLAFLLFNKGKFPNFPGTQLNLDLAARKKITMAIWGAVSLAIVFLAVVLFGSFEAGIWLIVGYLSIPILLSWIAILVGFLVRNRSGLSTRRGSST